MKYVNSFNRFLISLIYFAAVINCLAFNQLRAQDILESINKSGELKVGLTGNQPPYSMEAIDGSLIGFDVDLAQLIADAMDVKLKLVQMPFSELLNSLEEGTVNMVLSGLGMTTQRNMQFAFVGPYHMTGLSVLSKSADYTNRSTANVMNNKNVRLATLKKSTSEVFVLSQFPDAKLTTVSDYDEAIEMLRKDEIEAVIADFSQCTFASFKNPEDHFRVMRDLLTKERVGIALSPNDPLLINLITNLFNEFDETGVFIDLENEWFTNSNWISRVN